MNILEANRLGKLEKWFQKRYIFRWRRPFLGTLFHDKERRLLSNGGYIPVPVCDFFCYCLFDIPVEISVRAFCSSYDGNVDVISWLMLYHVCVAPFHGSPAHLVSSFFFFFVIIRFLRLRNTQATFPCWGPYSWRTSICLLLHQKTIIFVSLCRVTYRFWVLQTG